MFRSAIHRQVRRLAYKLSVIILCAAYVRVFLFSLCSCGLSGLDRKKKKIEVMIHNHFGYLQSRLFLQASGFT